MAKSCDLSFQQRSLYQQGYQRYTPAELRQLEWGLRFTPAACSLITLLALVYQMPYLLFAVASLGIWAFFFPAKHPMDLIYNHGVRHLFGAIALPANPLQRRLACFAAGIMNTVAGVLFLADLPVAAWVVGGSLLALQLVVITTHFCTLSWMYEGMMRVLGKWNAPMALHEAKTLLASGALLVDVRSPNEFARESLPGAVNMPLEDLHLHLEKIKAATCLLFCNSGTRSHIALQKLTEAGVDRVFNVGAFGRAKSLVPVPA